MLQSRRLVGLLLNLEIMLCQQMCWEASRSRGLLGLPSPNEFHVAVVRMSNKLLLFIKNVLGLSKDGRFESRQPWKL